MLYLWKSFHSKCNVRFWIVSSINNCLPPLPSAIRWICNPSNYYFTKLIEQWGSPPRGHLTLTLWSSPFEHESVPHILAVLAGKMVKKDMLSQIYKLMHLAYLLMYKCFSITRQICMSYSCIAGLVILRILHHFSMMYLYPSFIKYISYTFR